VLGGGGGVVAVGVATVGVVTVGVVLAADDPVQAAASTISTAKYLAMYGEVRKCLTIGSG